MLRDFFHLARPCRPLKMFHMYVYCTVDRGKYRLSLNCCMDEWRINSSLEIGGGCHVPLKTDSLNKRVFSHHYIHRRPPILAETKIKPCPLLSLEPAQNSHLPTVGRVKLVPSPLIRTALRAASASPNK